jgi:integrase
MEIAGGTDPIIAPAKMAFGGRAQGDRQRCLTPHIDKDTRGLGSTSRRFQALVAAWPEVESIRPHDCRHTHSTLLLEAGEAMDYEADRLGDRLDTVAKVYAHLTRRRRDGGVARWAALKSQATPHLSAEAEIL